MSLCTARSRVSASVLLSSWIVRSKVTWAVAATVAASITSRQVLAARCVRMRPSLGEGGSQVAAGMRRFDLRDLFRCAGRDDATAVLAPFGTQVDHVVGRLDDVEVVLDHEQGVPRLEQLAERGEQLRDVVEVQPGRRLVQDVQQALPGM